MIAVPVWSNAQFTIILLSVLSTFALIVGGLLLAVIPPVRRWVGLRPKLRIGLLVSTPLLLLASLPTLVMAMAAFGAWRSVTAPESERHITLEHDQTIDGFTLPAGTHLDLIEAYEIDSFKHARFPHPVNMLDVTATGMNSVLPYSVAFTGTGEQTIAGWTCDATGEIEFSRSTDKHFDLDMKSPFHFSGCTLGHGNRIAGRLLLPANATIAEGTLHAEFFNVKVADPLPIGPGGALLKTNCLVIDRNSRMPQDMNTGLLVNPLKWKNKTWPAGTEVMWDAPKPGASAKVTAWSFFEHSASLDSNDSFSCLG